MNTNIPFTVYSSVVIDPTVSTTLYVGTEHGVFKSTDGGGTWTVSNTGLKDTEITALVLDPSNSQTLYVATKDGTFKSLNGGETWTLVSDLAYDDILSLAIDLVTPTTLYAGNLS